MTAINALYQPWRTGRKVGRTVYAQAGTDASDGDALIGTLDTPALAEEACRAHNERLARDAVQCGEPLAEAVYQAAEAAFEGWAGTRGSPVPGRDELEAAILAAEPLIRAAERERIRGLAERNGAVCPGDDGTSCYFADLIGEAP